MVKIIHFIKFALVILMLSAEANYLFVYAQKSNDNVTLITSGEGPTKDEATKVALRSAIEQAYGTFVSANTQILNDELVKDEIVTISSGSIKHFEVLSASETNGSHTVMVRATVSVSGLISYAKSKGSSAEFAGQTFAMNIKLMELREKNTITAFNNMAEQILLLASNGMFDYKIEIENPSLSTRTIYANGEIAGKKDGYEFNVKIKLLATPATSQIYSLVENTLNALQLNETEIKEYDKMKMPMYYYKETYNRYNRETQYVVLPISSGKQISEVEETIVTIVGLCAVGYKLVDIGNRNHYLTWFPEKIKTFLATCGNFKSMESFASFPYRGMGFLSNTSGETFSLAKWGMSYNVKASRPLPIVFSILNHSSPIEYDFKWSSCANVGQVVCEYTVPFFIPKNEMSSFGGFSVEPMTMGEIFQALEAMGK